MIIVNKVTFYWKVEKFLISLPEFVWVIDKGMQSFKKIYQVVMKLNRFFCPPLFRKRPLPIYCWVNGENFPAVERLSPGSNSRPSGDFQLHNRVALIT